MVNCTTTTPDGEQIKYVAKSLIKAATGRHGLKTIVTKGDLSYERAFDTQEHIVVSVEHSMFSDRYHLAVGYRSTPMDKADIIIHKDIDRSMETPLTTDELDYLCAQIKLLGG